MRSGGRRCGNHIICMQLFMSGHVSMLFQMRGQKSLKHFVGVNLFCISRFMKLVQIYEIQVTLSLSIGGVLGIMCGMLIEAICQIRVMKRMLSPLFMKIMLTEILKSGKFFPGLFLQTV